MIFESNAFWVFLIIVMAAALIWLVSDLIERYLDRRERELFEKIFNEFDDNC